jgi:Glycosyltransferase sugar-binding region containing DXD motif
MEIPLYFSLLGLILSMTCTLSTKETWNSPLLPPLAVLSTFNSPVLHNRSVSVSSSGRTLVPKKIPRSVWIGFRDKPTNDSVLHPHIISFRDRAVNDSWKVNMLGNKEQLEFMELFWPNTSVLWAYKVIHPLLGNAACDIWRYATLYALGGLYLDDDSYIHSSLEDLVHVNDTLIVSIEKNEFRDNCYVKSHHLSAHALSEKFPNGTSFLRTFLGNRLVVSWGILSAPQNPVILRVLQNIVEVIRGEYVRKPVAYMLNTELRWKIVMCATGPSVLTHTLREYALEAHYNESIDFPLRAVKKDFAEYGGVFKVGMGADSRHKYPVSSAHYMVAMQKSSIPLLSSYVPFNISYYEGRAISPGGKRYYLVENGSSHIFPNFDTMTARGFDISDVIFMINWTEFTMIPEGAKLTPIAY